MDRRRVIPSSLRSRRGSRSYSKYWSASYGNSHPVQVGLRSWLQSAGQIPRPQWFTLSSHDRLRGTPLASRKGQARPMYQDLAGAFEPPTPKGGGSENKTTTLAG